MFRKICQFVIISLLILSCKQERAALTSETYSEVLNKELTGDLAYETTAFVEKYWRVVGNTGFNESIYKVAEQLESAGFVNEDTATPEQKMTYRIETRPLEKPTWEPVNAHVSVEGDTLPLLLYSSNRNMIAINSHSTPATGLTAEVIHVENPKAIGTTNVKGKIVYAETHPYRIYKSAIVEGGALGIVTYNNPKYLQPEKNVTSIQFRSIPYDSINKSWGIALSYQANQRLKKKLSEGKVMLNVSIDTKLYKSEELTIVANIKGSELPEERLVFSAHVQEPGANDNASGVGVALEMAAVAAKLYKEKTFVPKRTLTFLWGDEIISTRRYVQEDSLRAKNIKWGISLDMVGENTALTGGSFLIEKMPDPSAIWTRGNDKHTEWGGQKLELADMRPHYLNDLVIEKFEAQGTLANWEVNTNPYEGGSDHVPFLRGDIPSVLFWHFTDQFYHTDNDRLDKVSKATLKNVGVAALVSAFELLNADANTAKAVLKNIERAATSRLQEELKQGKIAIENGDSLSIQETIIKTWEDWYLKAANSTTDMVNEENVIATELDNTKKTIKKVALDCLNQLR